MTGLPPFSELDELSLLMQMAQSTQTPTYPADVSDELRDFLDCCFQVEPNRRANVYELLRHPFIQQMKLKQPLQHLAQRGIEQPTSQPARPQSLNPEPQIIQKDLVLRVPNLQIENANQNNLQVKRAPSVNELVMLSD